MHGIKTAVEQRLTCRKGCSEEEKPKDAIDNKLKNKELND